MKSLIRSLPLGAVLLMLFIAPQAGAVEGLILDWGPDCFGWETDYDAHMSAPGSNLTVVGLIDHFFDPFLDLDPGSTEYSFIFRDLVSLGSIDLGGIVITDYVGGFFEIYEDPSNNADFGVNPPSATSPATFTDGTLILAGFLANFSVVTFMGPGGYSGTYLTDFEFNGGAMYDRVEGCYGTSGGGLSDDPATNYPMGYNFIVDGHMNVDDCRPTGSESTNWGAVKEMFR